MANLSRAEVLRNADGLASCFESHEPKPEDVRDAAPLKAIRDALTRGDEEGLRSAVRYARRAGHAWTAIGAMLAVPAGVAKRRFMAT